MTPRPLSASAFPASNCGLTRATSAAPPGRSRGQTAGRTVQSEMKDRSITTTSKSPPRQLRGREMTGVDLFQGGHAGVGLQLGMELAPPHVHAHDRGRAGLQDAVGESAGRSPDVEHLRAAQVEAESLQGGLELFAAPADEAGRTQDLDLGLGGEFPPGLVQPLGAAAHPAGHDQRLGLGARRGQAAGDQQFVKSELGHGISVGRATSRWCARRWWRGRGECRCAGRGRPPPSDG